MQHLRLVFKPQCENIDDVARHHRGKDQADAVHGVVTVAVDQVDANPECDRRDKTRDGINADRDYETDERHDHGDGRKEDSRAASTIRACACPSVVLLACSRSRAHAW